MQRNPSKPQDPITEVKALIGPHLHPDTRSGFKEIVPVYENIQTGTIVYQTTTFLENHTPDFRWYTVAHLRGWKTTHSSPIGDLVDHLGSYPFSEAIETRDSIIIVVKEDDKKDIACIEFNHLKPYVEEEEERG